MTTMDNEPGGNLSSDTRDREGRATLRTAFDLTLDESELAEQIFWDLTRELEREPSDGELFDSLILLARPESELDDDDRQDAATAARKVADAIVGSIGVKIVDAPAVVERSVEHELGEKLLDAWSLLRSDYAEAVAALPTSSLTRARAHAYVDQIFDGAPVIGMQSLEQWFRDIAGVLAGEEIE